MFRNTSSLWNINTSSSDWWACRMSIISTLNELDKTYVMVWGASLVVYSKHQDLHDDVMTWKRFLHYWPSMRGIHRSPVDCCFFWCKPGKTYKTAIFRWFEALWRSCDFTDNTVRNHIDGYATSSVICDKYDVFFNLCFKFIVSLSQR